MRMLIGYTGIRSSIRIVLDTINSFWVTLGDDFNKLGTGWVSSFCNFKRLRWVANDFLLPYPTLTPTSQQFWTQRRGGSPEATAENEMLERNKKIKEMLKLRLYAVDKYYSGIIPDISRDRVGKRSATDLYTLLDRVCDLNCRHCNDYENCWGKNFYSTYHEIFDLLASAELYGEVNIHQLKGRLARDCYQQYKLLTTINQLFGMYQTALIWRKGLETVNHWISESVGPMEEVCVFSDSLPEELLHDAALKEELENGLKHSLTKLGIPVRELTISGFSEKGVEVNLCQQECCKVLERQDILTQFVSTMFGSSYVVWRKECYHGDDYCTYVLLPEHHYQIRTTVCKLPKRGNQDSGDYHALHQLKDGNFVTIISDGMGHGRKAAEESRVTVNLLERLLDQEITHDFMVKMVNSLIASDSPEESFATVDVSMINLYNARAEFIKIGAAATYIKRGREVLTVRSTSLPAGILNSVDVERTVTQLKSGDFVIMVTDGVVDSKPETDKQADWLVRALSKVEVAGPESLGEYLLNLARINQSGAPKDDMTVVVLQIVSLEGNVD